MAILVIDDEGDIRYMLERFLSKEGYQELHFASSAVEAFKFLGIDGYNNEPVLDLTELELILLDVMMPEIDGIEACEKIKSDSRMINIPVIIVTALTDVETLKKAFTAGAIDYITKPVRRVELLARVNSAINLTRERKTRIKREQELEDALQLLEEKNKTLEKLATIDELTQLPNRRLLDETLKNELKRSKRKRSCLAFLILDIDYFKNYNDTYGHQKGDECLSIISGKLNELMLRPGDFAARYGGEEFAVILPETCYEGAMAVAERVRHEIEGLRIPHVDSKISDVVTVSVGVTSTDFNNENEETYRIESNDVIDSDIIDNLIKSADNSLYKAKEKGRNRVAYNILQ